MFGQIKRHAGKAVLGTMAATALLIGNGALPAAAELYSADEVVDASAPAIDEYWAEILDGTGFDYVSPDLYYYNTPDQPGNIDTGCGESILDNAFYCAADNAIYLDYAYLQREVDEQGDFVAARTLAHEWGHYIEEIVGIWVTDDGDLDEEGEVFNIENELLADCFAGTVTTYFEELGMLEPGDVDEAASYTFNELGDPDGYDQLNDDAHGSGEQRVEVYLGGYETGDPSTCGDIVASVLE